MHFLVKLSYLDFVNNLFLYLIKSINLFIRDIIVVSLTNFTHYNLNLRDLLFAAIF